MTADRIATELGELIAQEIGCAQRLLRRLEAEQVLITRRDTRDLAEVISKKEQDLKALQALTAAHDRLLKAAGYDPDRAGFGACLGACDPGGTLRTLAQERDALFSDCQRLNRINAAVLELTRRGVEQALALLHDRAAQDNTYGPAGRPVGQTDSRSLCKA